MVIRRNRFQIKRDSDSVGMMSEARRRKIARQGRMKRWDQREGEEETTTNSLSFAVFAFAIEPRKALESLIN